LAGATKFEMFPYNSTVFFIRLENMADDDFDTYYDYYEKHEDDDDIDIPEEDEDNWDEEEEEEGWKKKKALREKFDYDEEHMNLEKLAALLIQKHMRGIVGVKYSMEETSLTGVERYSQMVEEKTKWTGADDEYLDESFFPRDQSEKVVTLEAQRIRMFKV